MPVIRNLYKNWDNALYNLDPIDFNCYNAFPKKYEHICIINRMREYIADHRANNFADLANLMVREMKEDNYMKQLNEHFNNLEWLNQTQFNALNTVNNNVLTNQQLVRNDSKAIHENNKAINQVAKSTKKLGQQVEKTDKKINAALFTSVLAYHKANAVLSSAASANEKADEAKDS